MELAVQTRYLGIDTAHNIVGGGNQFYFCVARTVGIIVNSERLQQDKQQQEVNFFYEQKKLDHLLNSLCDPNITDVFRSDSYH